jgi:hypothetical protein
MASQMEPQIEHFVFDRDPHVKTRPSFIIPFKIVLLIFLTLIAAGISYWLYVHRNDVATPKPTLPTQPLPVGLSPAAAAPALVHKGGCRASYRK